MKRAPATMTDPDALSFAVACQQVIALRWARIALGGNEATREATRMLTEKAATAIRAQFAAVAALATGGPGEAAVAAAAVYRRAVRANGRRLSRG